MLSGHLRGCFIPWGKKALSGKVLVKTACSWFAFMGLACNSLPCCPRWCSWFMSHSLTYLDFSRSEAVTRPYIWQAAGINFLRSVSSKQSFRDMRTFNFWSSLSEEREGEKQDSVRKDMVLGAPLVAHWLRICLLMQGTQVQWLLGEDPTCCRATKPGHQNYRACTLEPMLLNKRSHSNETPMLGN